VRLKPNNGQVFTIIFSIFNRGLNPNTLQVFKKILCSSYKARGLIVVGTDEIINNQGMVSVSVADPDPGSSAFLTPGSGMGRKSGSGTGIWFFWVKIL
jgi:hypothetical protein